MIQKEAWTKVSDARPSCDALVWILTRRGSRLYPRIAHYERGAFYAPEYPGTLDASYWAPCTPPSWEGLL